MVQLSDEVRALLSGPNYAHLATLLPDGAPHSVPVWVTEEDGRIAFFTQPTSRKARNVERDARVALSIAGHDNPYRMAQVRGRVVDSRVGDEALAVMDRMSRKYTGADFPMRSGVLYLIEPEHEFSFDLPFSHRPGA